VGVGVRVRVRVKLRVRVWGYLPVVVAKRHDTHGTLRVR
jgi:hypothetical protein